MVHSVVVCISLFAGLVSRNTTPAAPSSPDALQLGFRVRDRLTVRVREALVILAVYILAGLGRFLG